jgi:hypothetical protein
MKTTRDQLIEIIRKNMQLFTEMGCKPTDDAVVKAMADYIIALAPHIVDGTVQFEIGTKPERA